MTVGRALLKADGDISLGSVARSLNVDVRTLWNWRNEVKVGLPRKPMGRPKYSAETHKKVMWKVGRELNRQGYPGWRAVAAGLKVTVPVRLIQLYVKKFKKKRERRKKDRILLHQIRVEVLAREVIWGQDGTHIGRKINGHDSIESQVIKDRGSLSTIGIQTGASANHEDVIQLLERTAIARNGYPIVFSRDNGAIYNHPNVLNHLENKNVIVLRSLPYTSEHNGATEICIRELKEAAQLGKGCKMELEVGIKKINQAQATLNNNRLRASKGFKTATEMDEKLSKPTSEQRDLFYRMCKARMKAAVDGQKSIRAGRMAEREEVFRTLEEFGFIKRTRGGKPYVSKSEIIL